MNSVLTPPSPYCTHCVSPANLIRSDLSRHCLTCDTESPERHLLEAFLSEGLTLRPPAQPVAVAAPVVGDDAPPHLGHAPGHPLSGHGVLKPPVSSGHCLKFHCSHLPGNILGCWAVCRASTRTVVSWLTLALVTSVTFHKENRIICHLWTTIRVSSKDPTGTKNRGAPRVFPGVSLVKVNVPRAVVNVVEGPHVFRQGGLPLYEGVVGEPHAVTILALTPGLQTFDKLN